MNNIKKMNNLNNFILLNELPILMDNSSFLNMYIKINQIKFVKIDATLSAEQLGLDGFSLADWFKQIEQYKNERNCILILDNFQNVSVLEQMKFYELFKYKKIGTNLLPKNCAIVVVIKDLKKMQFSQTISSLFAYCLEE